LNPYVSVSAIPDADSLKKAITSG
jgi:hypothetical protein